MANRSVIVWSGEADLKQFIFDRACTIVALTAYFHIDQTSAAHVASISLSGTSDTTEVSLQSLIRVIPPDGNGTNNETFVAENNNLRIPVRIGTAITLYYADASTNHVQLNITVE